MLKAPKPSNGSAGDDRARFDLAEMIRSEDDAIKSEQRLKLALEVAETLVWELDFQTGTVTSVGDVGRFFDRELRSANFVENLLCTVHPEDRARVEGAWEETIGRGAPFQLEYRLERLTGDDFWVLGSAKVFRDTAGEPQRIIGALRDINPRKQKDFALERALEAAEAANRAKSEFLANMSHEIRTPLNGVLGVAGALGRSELDSNQRDMVRLIETSAQGLERLLSDVLDLARIESGRLELRSEAFSLSELLGSTTALFAKQAQDKGIGFYFEQVDRLDGRLIGDPVRLRQILSNLLSNAVKFTPSGRVTLRVEAAAPQAGRQRVLLSVTDTGVGFDADARERLFQRFEQADGSITRRFGGTGLGLAISRSLADAMGATIEATGAPGSGACFTLTLELDHVSEQGAGSAAPSRPEPASERTLRVLLAEDHPINRKVVELILGSAGVAFTVAEDGAQAVDACATQPRFDLILMDMQMPVMDGLSAIRAIRTMERRSGEPATPILCLTANAMPEHLAASRDAGADGHLSKPISAAVLLGAVEAVRKAASPVPVALSA